MRKDPPVDMQYIYCTQLLDLVERKCVLVVNKPQSLRDFNEKLFVNLFPQCCPPTLVYWQTKRVLKTFCRNRVILFVNQWIVWAARWSSVLSKAMVNANGIIETLTENQTKYIIAQTLLAGNQTRGIASAVDRWRACFLCVSTDAICWR